MQQLILGNVLDALDDLYDRRERAALNLWRLLVASGAAVGPLWDEAMLTTAANFLKLIRGGDGEDAINSSALVLTGDLRQALTRVL